jgi:uncharacterized membrane protein
LTINVIIQMHANDPVGEEIIHWLESLRAEYPHSVTRRDENLDATRSAPPVVEVDGRLLPAPLSFAELKSALAVAGAVAVYKEETHVPAPIRKLAEAADNFSIWFSRHWLAFFNSIVFLYLAFAFLPALLMKLGLTAPASWLYTVYSFSCHQLGFRSFFLFGEQFTYPRDIFTQFTGIDPNNILAARSFEGTELLGYKVALCERDVAIYGSIVLAGLVFSILRRKIKVPALSFLGWLALGIFPIGLDGGSQLLSYLPWHIFPARESTAFLRTLTGALFGITSVWFAYPYVDESMETDIAPPGPAINT